eukprot:7977964-Pyramimonas_sp.AAC.1
MTTYKNRIASEPAVDVHQLEVFAQLHLGLSEPAVECESISHAPSSKAKGPVAMPKAIHIPR